MATFLSLLSIAIPIIRWIFDIFKVDKAKQDAFIAKIQSAKDDSLISIEMKDEFARQDAELARPEPAPQPEEPK